VLSLVSDALSVARGLSYSNLIGIPPQRGPFLPIILPYSQLRILPTPEKTLNCRTRFFYALSRALVGSGNTARTRLS